MRLLTAGALDYRAHPVNDAVSRSRASALPSSAATQVITASRFLTGTETKRNIAVSGVMLVIFLFAIDATIVATSMPTVVAQLGGLELYSWVFSIYMLASALATPIFGKLADLYSRRRLMLTGIGIFLLGSILCGAAPNMEMMVLFRAIQGLGGGAIYALSFIVVGVLYPAEKRARMQGIISSIWGIASILGPVAGAVIVEHWSWRWIFFVNLPLIAIASALIVVGLKEPQRETRAPALDLKGAALLLIGLLLLFSALAQSAHALHPLNAGTAGLFAMAVAVLVLFAVVERRAAEPIVPLDLFQLRLFRLSAVVAMLCSMGVFGALTYLPLYLQGVVGISATYAGMALLVLSMGWTGGSLIAGQLINRAGYRWIALAGMAFLAAGYGLFLAPNLPQGLTAVLISAAVIGLGMGLANLTTLVAAQSGVRGQRIGVATSTVMLCRTFGGAFAVSLMGTVLLNRMQQGLLQLQWSHPEVPDLLWTELANPQNLLQPSTRAQIPAELLPSIVATLDHALWYAFLTGFVLMVIGIVISARIPGYTPAKTPKD